MVPKLRDIVKTVSKVDTLDGAAEYSRMLGEQDLALSKEKEELAKRNAALRQRLAAAKRELDRKDTVWDDMRFIKTEDTSALSYGLSLDDFDPFNARLFPILPGLDMF